MSQGVGPDEKETPQRTRVPWRVIGVVAGVMALVVACWRVDLVALSMTLRQANPGWVALVVALNFVVLALRAWRWHALMSAASPLPFVPVLHSTLVGAMANIVLPARAGELARVMVLARNLKSLPLARPSSYPIRSTPSLGRAAILASLGLDHVVEGAGMIVVLAFLPLITTTPTWLRSTTLGLVAGVLVLLTLGTTLAGARKHTWVSLLPLPAKATGWLQQRLMNSALGFAAMRRPRYLAAAFTIGLAAWGAQAVMVWWCMAALQLPLGMGVALLVLMAVNVGLLAPGAPGSVGTFELAAVLALAFSGVPKSTALAFALLYHVAQLIPTMVVGMLALPLLGGGWRDLTQSLGARAE